MNKIRFNLGRGKNFMKWQVTREDGNVSYYDPDHVSLVMRKCKLRNQKSTSTKIHEGANKTVCAWIDAEEVEFVVDRNLLVDWRNDRQIQFNPRKNPHWTYVKEIEDIDNEKLSIIITEGRSLFQISDCEQ